MFKRVSSLVLAVLMVLTMLGATVYAAEAEIKVSVSVNDTVVERGETVTVTYYAESAKAWNAVSIESAYDPAVLTYVSAQMDGGSVEVHDNGGLIKFAAVGCEAAAGKTAVATAKFTVNNTAVNGAEAVVTAKLTALDAVLNVPAEASAKVTVVCFHSAVAVDETHHAYDCPTCGTGEEACQFVVQLNTVTDVAHGEYPYDVWQCASCTNVKKVYHQNKIPHNSDGIKSLGNGNADKKHQIVCTVDGTVMGTEACTFSDQTGCQMTCDRCGAVYANDAANVTHKETEEHYYAPAEGGKITALCTICGKEETVKTGSWSFTDVTSEKWYYDAVTFNNAYGLFNGTSATTFSPSKTINRAQAATVLSRMMIAALNDAAGRTVITEDALNAMTQAEITAFVGTTLNALYGLETVANIPAFADVPAGSYYGGHVRLMATLGIINGKSSTSFAPADTITRQELAKLMAGMVKTLEKINKETYTSFGAPVAAYSDAANISAWAKESVEFVRSTGLMNGKNGNAFDPKGTATRAEVATLLMRVKVAADDITTHM